MINYAIHIHVHIAFPEEIDVAISIVIYHAIRSQRNTGIYSDESKEVIKNEHAVAA